MNLDRLYVHQQFDGFLIEYHRNAVAISKHVVSLNARCSCGVLHTISDVYKGKETDRDLLRWK